MHRAPSSIVLSQTGGPLYEQIVNRIKERIAFEEWKAGDAYEYFQGTLLELAQRRMMGGAPEQPGTENGHAHHGMHGMTE